jgi:hypothetical protein
MCEYGSIQIHAKCELSLLPAQQPFHYRTQSGITLPNNETLRSYALPGSVGQIYLNAYTDTGWLAWGLIFGLTFTEY